MLLSEEIRQAILEQVDSWKGRMKSRILIADDEASLREFLEIFLKKEGYEVQRAKNGKEALDLIKKRNFDLVISDLKMPGLSGIELLKAAQLEKRDLLFIMITAFGSTESAVEAMKLGAYDYICKPFKLDEIRLIIKQALRSQSLEIENRLLRRELGQKYDFHNLLGDSEKMHEVFKWVQKASQSLAHVLIMGESGTGKSMIAKAIHCSGVLKEKVFVSVNCGAVAESLIESEFFGYKKGAFTGAIQDKKGLFERANGGTLFLDEIGELSLKVQAKLLRVLQEKKIRLVGGLEDIALNIRIISATNRNLEEMVKAKEFREDLFYRLNVLNIQMPPLRERLSDIPMLAEHFLKKHSQALKKSVFSISQEAMEELKSYSYPGNVRELENFIERAVALEGGSMILPENLPPIVISGSSCNRLFFHNIEVTHSGLDLEKLMNQIEKDLLVKAIDKANGIKKRAADLLKITFRSMRYRLKKHNLNVQDSEGKEEIAS